MKAKILIVTALAVVLFPWISRTENKSMRGENQSVALDSHRDLGGLDENLFSMSIVVRCYVDHDGITGAELLVIKNQHTILQKVFSRKDYKQNIAIERNTIFYIISVILFLLGISQAL